MNEIQFLMRTTAGRSPVDLSEDRTIISYADSENYEPDIDWDKDFLGENNGDDLLDHGEKVLITLDSDIDLEANEEFVIEVKIPAGPVFKVTRRCPCGGGDIINLH